MKHLIQRLVLRFAKLVQNELSQCPQDNSTTELLAIGKLLCNQQKKINSRVLSDFEFKIFSQFGEDGIIQYLINNIPIENKVFVEFGVEDYQESNTRFLMMNNNWSGLVIDGSEKNINNLKKQEWFWRYDLEAIAAFIDKDNINTILNDTKYKNIGILSIDIDGNDYHILKQINIKRLNPAILITEYNSVFGKNRSITIPYDSKFQRTSAHYSNLYYGASLAALTELANNLNYALIGCTSTGNNAFFIQRNLIHHTVFKELTADQAYVESRFRESRDTSGALSFCSGNRRIEQIKGLPVINIKNGTLEML